MKWQSWQAEPELTDAPSFFLRVNVLPVSAEPSKSSVIGTLSAVATRCSRPAPTRLLPFSYF
jgi:hypothetical protein